jgi:hypothetical protein
MFIRKRLTFTKRNGEGYSYQLIETYREGGKIKQRVLYNLARCPTIEAAIEWERCKIEIAKAEIANPHKYYCSGKPISEVEQTLQRMASSMDGGSTSPNREAAKPM